MKGSAVSQAEKRRIARELGIDINDLSLLPNEKDILLLDTPARRQVRFSQLQAYAYPDAGEQFVLDENHFNIHFDDDNESYVSSMQRPASGKAPSQMTYSPMSTPRRQTYKQFRKARKKLKEMPDRITKHYSSVIKIDQWDMLQGDNDAVLQVIFTEEMRKKKRRNLCIWASITGVLFLYISFLLAFFWKQWTTECVRQLSIWLAVYEFIIVLQLGRALLLLHAWKVSPDPSIFQVKVDCLWSIVFICEVGWSIYGNTFIYSSGSQYCTGTNDADIEAYYLWVSALLLICWGYCLMVYAFGILVFAFGLYCVYRERNKNLPTNNNMNSLD